MMMTKRKRRTLDQRLKERFEKFIAEGGTVMDWKLSRFFALDEHYSYVKADAETGLIHSVHLEHPLAEVTVKHNDVVIATLTPQNNDIDLTSHNITVVDGVIPLTFEIIIDTLPQEE